MGEISTIQENMAVGNDNRSEMIFSRLIYVCIAITAVISGIAILGWMLDRLILAGISTNYVPMALSSALLFIIMSAALLVYTCQTVSINVRMIARVGVFLAILISLIIFIDFFTGMTFDIERVLINRPEKLGLFPIDRMSPISAANFLLAGSALLLLLTSPAAWHRARGVAAGLATLVISVGFVILLGYLYGTPLLYGGTIIPVALTSALVFVFLGIGIMLAAGKHYWPLSSFIGSSVSARLLRFFLPVTIALVLIHNWLDVIVFKNVVDDVLVSSLMTILSVIILGIIIPKISHVIGSDIDRANFEKERAVETLQESEIRYRRLFEAAQDGVLLLDADTGKITDVNPFLINILGYSYDEFLVKELWEIGLFKDIAASKAAFLDLQNRGYVRYEDLPLKTKDGRTIDLEFVSNVYLVNDKKVIQCNIRDITERKRMEEALRRSEEHFRSLIENSFDIIMAMNAEGTLRYLSPSVERMLGYRPEYMVGENALDFVHPDDAPDVIKAITTLAETHGIAASVEFRVRHKDGTWRIQEALGKSILDESGAVSIIVNNRDITERKRTEEELKKYRDHLDELVKERTIELAESEDKFKSIFDYAQDGILLVDVATKKFLIGNRMICEMLGYAEGDFKNISVNDIHPEKDLPYVMEQFEKQKRREIEVASDIPVKRKDGSIFYADIKSCPVIIGGKTYLLGTFRDITGRKSTEELVKLEDKRLQSLLKISMHKPETLNKLLNMALEEVVSLSDSKVGYIYYYSEEKEEFTLHAWSKNVMESCTIQEPKTTYQLQKTGIWGEAVRQRKSIIVNDFQANNPMKKGYPEGHTPLFRFMTLPFFSNERIVAVVGVGNKETDYNDIDVHQLKQMIDSIWLIAQRQQAEESMRLAKEEAEHANKAKTNFLNTMSHELRTPLNAVLGFSELLKENNDGELNEKQKRFIDNIQTGGNNLLNIISQILDFVKMDEGKLELHIEKIPVPETLDEIITVIKEKASKKNVVLEKTVDPKLMDIETDKQKLMQILIYLLDNALKFSKPEGGIVTVTSQKEGDMAKFSVSDTGIGIKEEEMAHLFEKFTQLDPGLNRRYGGTGIGLALVKQIVELHGGRIWAESKFGEGSTFTFLIPLKDSHH